ncbi:ABC transporter permease subunit [Opitutaceae bacterium TAV4]|uniref:ABC transporter permease n=1 Tax=Geminisphaera colitermitum TaxID=1148786 RepID=UPI0001964FCB|nr:ABC transporter permease subunit [Geminisphaera colitermitum]RRJ97359.1 ABC transporter permease subunit [Opitutaceae bacterium TAV4]RRK01753.1 ABC transporter permease subunit [Opitutaceae bacterium TAV3]
MFRFIARRLLETIPVLFVIVTVTFFMLRFVPGGPFTSEKAVSKEILRNLEAHYGLDKPLHQQYLNYLWDLCPKKFDPRVFFGEHNSGLDLKAALGIDLGPSFKYPNRTVNEIIAQKLPVSLELGGWALLIALTLGVTLGVAAAVRKNSLADYAASTVAMIGICVPTFVLGPLLVLLFAIHLGWLPPSGWYGPVDRVLPALTLGLVYAAYIARLTRGGMLEVLNQDYIRTARAKGASELRIVLKHALRGGLLPLVSYLGPAIAGVISGSFVIETIFQIPGLGREFVTSVFNRDFTLVLGTVLLYAALIVLLNLLVDIVQVWLNPKLKFE